MKQVFLATIFLFFVAPIFAQFDFCPKVSYGLTRLEIDPTDFETASRPSYSIGADFRMGDRLYFNPGVFYHVMNYYLVDISETGFGNPVEDIVGVKCLKIPGYLGFKLVDGDNFRLRAYGGGTFYQRLGINKEEFGLSKDVFQRRFWGADAGLGFDIFFITFDFRYEWGQAGIYKDLPETKYTTFEVSAGLRLF